jgi:hypothetical protein
LSRSNSPIVVRRSSACCQRERHCDEARLAFHLLVGTIITNSRTIDRWKSSCSVPTENRRTSLPRRHDFVGFIPVPSTSIERENERTHKDNTRTRMISFIVFCLFQHRGVVTFDCVSFVVLRVRISSSSSSSIGSRPNDDAFGVRHHLASFFLFVGVFAAQAVAIRPIKARRSPHDLHNASILHLNTSLRLRQS